MPGLVAGVAVPLVHGACDHGAPRLSVQPQAAVELVADGQRIAEIKRDHGRGDVAGKAFDHDADLLHVGLGIVGGAETEVGVFRQGLRGHGTFSVD